jgi:hypothetical protein
MIGLYEKLCIIIGVMKISVNFLRLKKKQTNKLELHYNAGVVGCVHADMYEWN